jgi:hypothetical protein
MRPAIVIRRIFQTPFRDAYDVFVQIMMHVAGFVHLGAILAQGNRIRNWFGAGQAGGAF